jgi:hypothetical protein
MPMYTLSLSISHLVPTRTLDLVCFCCDKIVDENPNPSALLWELLSTTRSQHSPFLVGISLINPLPLLRTTVDIFAGNGSCPRKRSHETHDGPPAKNNDDTSACFHTQVIQATLHTHRAIGTASGHTPAGTPHITATENKNCPTEFGAVVSPHVRKH